MKDYYEILGVAKSASSDEIKGSYKKLVKKNHPDVSKETDATERFQEITNAYEILSDSEKRSQYDKFGPQYEKNYSNQSRNNYYSGFNSSNFQSVNLSGWFSKLDWWKKVLLIIGIIVFSIVIIAVVVIGIILWIIFQIFALFINLIFGSNSKS